MTKLTTVFVLFISMAALVAIAAESDVVEPSAVSISPTPTPPASNPPDAESAPRISLADAKNAFDEGTATFIDTHAKAIYDAGHVPGAINVTIQELEEKFSSIPKGRRIIAYCS